MLDALLQLRDYGAEVVMPWPVGWAERRTAAAAHAGGMRLVNAFTKNAGCSMTSLNCGKSSNGNYVEVAHGHSRVREQAHKGLGIQWSK